MRTGTVNNFSLIYEDELQVEQPPVLMRSKPETDQVIPLKALKALKESATKAGYIYTS